MVKRLFIAFILGIVCSSIHAQRSGRMTIQGRQCLYDTIAHRSIAPGATYTEFQFNSILIGGVKYKMRTHLITIDNTNPYNKVSTYLSKGEYFTATNQLKEVERQKALGLKPIASIEGAAFTQSNLVSKTKIAYEMNGSFVINNELKFGDNTNHLNYYIDAEKTTRMLTSHFEGKVISENGSYAISQLNHSRAYAGNDLALFCNGITKSNAKTENTGIEVVIKKTDGQNFTNGDNVCKVVRRLTGSFNIIGKDEAILSGEGSAAEAYLNSLQIDEEITISLNHYDKNGNIVDASHLMAALTDTPYISGGEVLPLDLKNTAQAGVGFSKDGKTSYWAQMEISTNSNAPAICLADFMLATGSWDALKLDGGPSAEITIDGEWATTSSVGNGFNGRLIPAGLILYSVAPKDNILSYLEVDNPKQRTLKREATCSFNLFGFNQYGEMIDAHAATNPAVSYSCPEGLGEFVDGVFTAKRGGLGHIEIKVENTGFALSIPIKVIEDRKLIVYPKTFFTGEGRECQASLQCDVAGNLIDINPQEATWSTDNPYVVKSCTNGLITPYVDGFAQVYVNYDGLKDSIQVTVENLEEEGTLMIDLTGSIEESNALNIKLQSVPQCIVADVTASPSESKKITLHYKTGETEKTHEIDLEEDGTARFEFQFDYENPETYPITLLYLSGEEGQSITINDLKAFYTLETGIKANFGTSLTNFNVRKKEDALTIENQSEKAENCVIEVFTLSGTSIIRHNAHIEAKAQTALPNKYASPVVVRISTKEGSITTKCY